MIKLLIRKIKKETIYSLRIIFKKTKYKSYPSISTLKTKNDCSLNNRTIQYTNYMCISTYDGNLTSQLKIV